MTQVWRQAAAVLAAAAFFLAVLGASEASADTQYGPSGWGKTYRNNWVSSCIWWNGGGPNYACYLGVWSETGAESHVVEVAEYAENLTGSCLGSYCTSYYAQIPSWPSTATAWGVASTSHYDPDAYPFPSPTRGYASHRDWSYNGGADLWWTSDGY